MGSLAGHVIPGTFFVVYGLEWIVLSMWIDLKASAAKNTSKESRCVTERNKKCEDKIEGQSWLPMCICPNFPLEPILKITLPAIGIFVEIFLDYGEHHQVVWRVYSLYDDHGVVQDQGKLHHTTMYSGFILSGIVDILVIFLNFPAYTSKLFLSLAFTVECTLFYLHTAGRSEINTSAHSILTFVIFFSLIFSLLRLVSSKILAINLGFGSCLLLQGTWLIQAGYYLFNFLPHQKKIMSESNHDHHGLLMLFAETFAWHIFLVAIGCLTLWVILSAIIKGRIQKLPLLAVNSEECNSLISSYGGSCKEHECIELESEDPASKL